MSIESHLAELNRRHAALERELQDAQSHPSIDTILLTALKRRKLQVKEQIDRISAASPSIH